MKDVPIFVVKIIFFSPNNFIDKIGFQLSRTYDGQNYHDVANNWKKVNEIAKYELICKETTVAGGMKPDRAYGAIDPTRWRNLYKGLKKTFY